MPLSDEYMEQVEVQALEVLDKLGNPVRGAITGYLRDKGLVNPTFHFDVYRRAMSLNRERMDQKSREYNDEKEEQAETHRNKVLTPLEKARAIRGSPASTKLNQDLERFIVAHPDGTAKQAYELLKEQVDALGTSYNAFYQRFLKVQKKVSKGRPRTEAATEKKEIPEVIRALGTRPKADPPPAKSATVAAPVSNNGSQHVNITSGNGSFAAIPNADGTWTVTMVARLAREQMIQYQGQFMTHLFPQE